MNEHSDPDNMSFMEFIGDNYYQEKSKLQKLCNGYNSILFDEDIFHDTIIKVNDVIDTKHYSPEVYDRYINKSFRTNLVRDKLYHRNSKTEHTFDFSSIEPYTYSYVESTIDFGNVINILTEKFGYKLTLFYIDWLSGFNIKEAMEKNNVDSGYYYVKQITDYIRSYHINGKIIY